MWFYRQRDVVLLPESLIVPVSEPSLSLRKPQCSTQAASSPLHRLIKHHGHVNPAVANDSRLKPIPFYLISVS